MSGVGGGLNTSRLVMGSAGFGGRGGGGREKGEREVKPPDHRIIVLLTPKRQRALI